MATQYAYVQGLNLLIEPLVTNVHSSTAYGEYGVAELNVLLPAYTSGTDTAQIGGGGYELGVATTSTLAAMIQNKRRDTKTVTIKAAYLLRPGNDGTNPVYTGAVTVSGGNLTFNLTQSDESTGLTTASLAQPLGLLVRYTLN